MNGIVVDPHARTARAEAGVLLGELDRRSKRRQQVHECLFKVSWDQKEPNKLGDRFARQRQITVGTTLAINAQTREVRALLTSDHEKQTAARDALLTELAARHLLGIGDENSWMPGRPIGSSVRVEQMKGVMRVRGTGRDSGLEVNSPVFPAVWTWRDDRRTSTRWYGSRGWT